MCGRYVSPDDAAIEREFNLIRSPGLDIGPNFNVAPTQMVPVVRTVDGVRQLSRMRWGLVPFFAKGVPGPYSTINARIETIETSASYRGPWQRGQRCIIPAAGFYEWHLNEDGKKPVSYTHLADFGRGRRRIRGGLVAVRARSRRDVYKRQVSYRLRSDATRRTQPQG